MKLNETQPQEIFTIRDTNETFDYWLHRPYVSDALREELMAADVLLVPQEKFRDHDGPLFPEGTSALLPFLQDNAGSLKVDICADDETYRELALHYDLVDVGMFVASSMAAPLLVNWIQKHLDRLREPDNTEVTCRVIVQQAPDGSRAVQADYRGPANELRDTFEPFLRDLADNSSLPSLPPSPSNDESSTETPNNHSND